MQDVNRRVRKHFVKAFRAGADIHGRKLLGGLDHRADDIGLMAGGKLFLQEAVRLFPPGLVHHGCPDPETAGRKLIDGRKAKTAVIDNA